jgi:hypothetical protein
MVGSVPEVSEKIESKERDKWRGHSVPAMIESSTDIHAQETDGEKSNTPLTAAKERFAIPCRIRLLRGRQTYVSAVQMIASHNAAGIKRMAA